MGSSLDAFRRRSTDWGLRRAIYWTFMHALARLGCRVHYVALTSGRDDLEDPDPPAIPPGYTVRKVSHDDLRPYANSGLGLSREFLDESSARNDECGAVFFGDALVAYTFITQSRTLVTDQLDALIPKGFEYSYKAWTHSDHRRRNLTKAARFALNHRPMHGFRARRIWYVETHNYPSLLHGYEHPNFRSLFTGYAGWITLFGRQIPFNSRHAKRIGFEFVRKSDTGVRQYVH